MSPVIVHVDDASRVAEVRRLAAAAAEDEGLTGQAAGELAIIATEIATNLVKHAQAGQVHISRLSHGGDPGVEILSIDRGPGMANLPSCVEDGFSTAGTAGNGLGAISRLAGVFDAYSQPGRGTVLVARKFSLARPNERKKRWIFGAVTVPYPGEQVCGDRWGLRRTGSATCLMVADGLGHGVLAADASSAAVSEFCKGPAGSPAAMLENVHLALRATRGAAVAIAMVEHESGKARYAGIGNIAGIVLGDQHSRFMISHNGTAGLAARRFQEFDYPIPAEGALVMHSDGLSSSWNLDSFPGLLRRHPAVIAGVLYREASRGRDDACVLVGRQIFE